MKEYNRIKRIWEEPQEKTGSLKKPKLCRGGKPHRFQLTLPKYLTGYSDVSPEAVEEYYKSEERIRECLDAENKVLSKFGIGRRHCVLKVVRYFKCEVCDKRDTEY